MELTSTDEHTTIANYPNHGEKKRTKKVLILGLIGVKKILLIH